MVTTAQRIELREELVANGYSWDWIDSPTPHFSLYRHAPGLSVDGNIVFPVGTVIKGLPGNPDYAVKKARLGLLPFPPNDTCECRWCTARRVDVEPGESKVEEEIGKESQMCQECGQSFFALTGPGALSKLRVHVKSHESTGESG